MTVYANVSWLQASSTGFSCGLFRLTFASSLGKALMLFYIKRFLSLEIAVTLLLGGLGYWGMLRSNLPLVLRRRRGLLRRG